MLFSLPLRAAAGSLALLAAADATPAVVSQRRPAPSEAGTLRDRRTTRRPARDGALPMNAETTATIRRVVRRATHALQRCAATARSDAAAHLSGVTLRFVLEADGTVTHAEAHARNGAMGSPTGACVVRVLRALRFPPPSSGRVTVTYPFYDSALE